MNLARPLAEVGILLERNPGGALTARLQWGHVLGSSPVSAIMKYDQRVVSRNTSGSAVLLPATTDKEAVHVVSAEMEFADGVRAQKEVVFGGVFSEEMPAELTAVAVRQRGTAGSRRPASRRVAGPSPRPRWNAGSGRRTLSSTERSATRGGSRLHRQPESKFALTDAEFRVVIPPCEDSDRGGVGDGGLYLGPAPGTAGPANCCCAKERGRAMIRASPTPWPRPR